MSLFRILKCNNQSFLKTVYFIEPTNFRKNLQIRTTSLIVHKSTDTSQLASGKEQCEGIVYVGPLSKQIRSVKLFTIITSMSGLFAQPVIYERAQELQASIPLIVGMCSFVGFFTFVTPVLLHAVTKKYVTQITYDKVNDAYTASVLTLLLRKREIPFKPGEPVVPDILGLFTSMTIRGIPLFIDARFFNDVNHYKKIMGYDKPIDFKLATPVKPTMTQ